MNIRNTRQLIDHVNQGHPVKYVFFWGHQKPKQGVNASCFSQWYEAPFEHNGITYQTAEHFMMAEKARVFDDKDTLQKILLATNPGEAKQLGREVNHFSDQVWESKRFDIVVKANLFKFDQHPELKTFLLGTKNRVLVEASPVDRIWGIGLAADHKDVSNPNHWKGLNLLGFALMEVRDRFSHEKN